MRLPFARRWTLVLAMLLLSGCWGSSAPPPPRQSLVAQFVVGTSDQIRATIVDALPVKTAVLKKPDGQTIVAEQIDKERNVYNERNGYYGGPGFGLGLAGGSNGGVSSGIGFGIPLGGGGFSNGGYRSRSVTTSVVRFKVPDMAAYRREWQQWVLHIELEDGANRRSIETLPPAPPQE